MASKKSLLVQHLIRAARGRIAKSTIETANATSQHLRRRQHPPLPWFALQPRHFGRIEGSRATDAHQSISDPNTFVPTPSDFHRHLCNKIKGAQDRIILASLYVGVGSSEKSANASEARCKEDELLHALREASKNTNINKIQIVLDANRALRKVSYTKPKNDRSNVTGDQSAQSHSSYGNGGSYSAKAVYSEINAFVNQTADEGSGVFLFPVNNLRLCSLLPSPLGEVAGVFHIKAYIIDDELILSGANLSEEYFTNRLDRYMSFVNGGGGLVDFYAALCNILCKYAVKYDGTNVLSDSSNLPLLFSSENESARKLELETSLMKLFNGENCDNINNPNYTTNPVACAIPTFQMPESFLGRPLNLHSDATITRNLLQTALDHDSSSSVRLSSAYLNLTPSLLSILQQFGRNVANGKRDNTACSNGSVYILTAGTISHGFAPKRGTRLKPNGFIDKIKDSIPDAFLTLVKQVAASIIARGGKVLMYERPGWTFHAKGVWITAEQKHNIRPVQKELIHDSSLLVSTIVGSGNYGARSEDLDVESNLVIVFNDATSHEKKMSSSSVKDLVAAEWNGMCRHCNELADLTQPVYTWSKVMQVTLGFLRRFL